MAAPLFSPSKHRPAVPPSMPARSPSHAGELPPPVTAQIPSHPITGSQAISSKPFSSPANISSAQRIRSAISTIPSLRHLLRRARPSPSLRQRTPRPTASRSRTTPSPPFLHAGIFSPASPSPASPLDGHHHGNTTPHRWFGRARLQRALGKKKVCSFCSVKRRRRRREGKKKKKGRPIKPIKPIKGFDQL